MDMKILCKNLKLLFLYYLKKIGEKGAESVQGKC